MMDDGAVSEVLGAIISFGIVSILVVVAVAGFQGAADGAVDRAVEQEADAVAQTVAQRVAQLGLWAQDHTDQAGSYRSHLDLPLDLEGRRYTIQVASDGKVTVDVQGTDISRVRTAGGIAGLSSHTLCATATPIDGPSAVLLYVDQSIATNCAAELSSNPNAIILLDDP